MLKGSVVLWVTERDAMSVVSHVAAQETDHGVPHAATCRLLGISESWSLQVAQLASHTTERRRAELDVKMRVVFESVGKKSCGLPRWMRSVARRRRNGLEKGRSPRPCSGQGLVGTPETAS